jgi:predicted phosphoribosyltransferase
VDDGLATGVTARAAVEALRLRGPGRLVLAAPVCAAQTAGHLRPEVDDLVCLRCPPDLGAIGFWYSDFEQTPDEEVVRLLEAARQRGPDPQQTGEKDYPTQYNKGGWHSASGDCSKG